MAPKKATSKALVIEASGSDRHIQDEPDVVGARYDDNSGILEKEGETLKWGDVYNMFKKSNFPTESEDQDEVKILKNIHRSGIFKVTVWNVIFPYVNAINLIIKHSDLGNKCVCNVGGNP
jgi:hypothetical protein